MFSRALFVCTERLNRAGDIPYATETDNKFGQNNNCYENTGTDALYMLTSNLKWPTIIASS